MDLQKYLSNNLNHSIIDAFEYDRWISRVKQGKLIREENRLSHFGSMFVPFSAESKEVFIVHHKKANSWIFPGGHIEPNELPPQVAVREIKEELGTLVIPSDLLGPFCLQIKDVENLHQICREHYDVFFAVELGNKSMKIDKREFFDSGWYPYKIAMQKIETDYYKRVLTKFISFMKW